MDEQREPRRKRRLPGRRFWLTLTALVLTAALSSGATWFVLARQSRADAKYAKLTEAARMIEQNYIGDVDTDAVIDGAIDGMLTGLGDKWSYYVPQSEMAEHMEGVNNAYVGIGVSVTKTDGAGLVIQKVTEGGGAADAGLAAGDTITAADGASLLDLSLEESKALIKGAEGTYVTLTVLHADGATEDVSVQRRTIEVETVAYEEIGTIGYIRIKNFNVGVADKFSAAVDALTADGVQGLVIDVRYNGGGRLSELIPMLDKLLPEGLIFTSVAKDGTTSNEYSDASCVELPMAVLVNDGTYSAAEYFAEALREYSWAAVVGQHTTGKGYSQATLYLSDGSALVLSTKAYYTPQGKSLADVGIQPDVEVALSDADSGALYLNELDHADDAQLQSALENVQAKLG